MALSQRGPLPWTATVALAATSLSLLVLVCLVFGIAVPLPWTDSPARLFLLLGSFVVFFPATVAALLWFPFALSWAGLQSLVLAGIGFLTFLTIRHLQIARYKLQYRLRISEATVGKSQRLFSGLATSNSNATPYFLVVLGSGGHTNEMFAMMRSSLAQVATLHRRYLISSGDSISIKHLEAFEQEVRQASSATAANNTFDSHVVSRARRVHQSLLTTPISALWSVFDILRVLYLQPGPAHSQGSTPPRFPDFILINGPATGFFVGLTAYLLKLLLLVPQDKMKVIYVESWARISTLSLTGKLFYHTGIADAFLVQHAPVAAKYGVINAGWLVASDRQR